jgi:hypothetical protein
VYINNLTETMVRRFDNGLSDYPAYVGIADTSYRSAFKHYLAMMLVKSFIKHSGVIIQGHEPDREPSEDVNMNGYPFEENGYRCRSVPDDLMGLLLSYKIELPVVPGFEGDTEFSLNAVSQTPMAISEFNVEVEEAKLQYLRTAKAGSLQRAGLQSTSADELGQLIRSKISGSYIYSMSVNADYNVTKFNVIIELPAVGDRPPTRLLAALEYQPERKTLRLITLY